MGPPLIERKMHKPNIFEHFPKDVVCPVCKTSEDTECLLIQIDGTDDDGICEGQPVHLYCAVATNFNKDMGLFYRKV
jgi:hypothetical protein